MTKVLVGMGDYYILWIWASWWPSVLLQASKKKELKKHWRNVHNCWITLPQIQMQWCVITHQIWWWIFTPTHCIYCKQKAQTQTCGHFFMGWVPQKGEPIKVNGAFHVNLSILWFVFASAAKAKLGALFHNCQTGIIFWSILDDLGHPQPKMPDHCDNTTAVRIANSTVRRQCSQSMEMRLFGLVAKLHKIYTHLHGIQDRKI